MVSTLNVAAVAIGALLFWTCLGSALTRRVFPATLWLPFAPTIGWAVHSALALPILDVRYEDLVLDVEGQGRRMLEFLGLPHIGDPDFRHLNARPRPAPMPDSVRAALEEHYRPYNERLAKWLGREPSWCR